ncbi:MAG: iron chelate uptake ABC transporter family permease subunit, partial [Ectothiorhodospiraceae bacterium]
MPRLPRITPGRLCGLMALALVALGGWSLISQTGLVTGLQAMLTQPDSDSTALALHFAWWPRLAMALLAGAALALAGVLFQQVLRNPLAAPTTLGVTSGAELALLAATLLAPGLLAAGREWVALAGGGLAMGLVFLLTWHRGLTPVVVV